LLAFLFVSAVFAQQAPTFRTSTHLVVQTVSVRDKDGKPIKGLTARDFIVTEDGVAQEIAFVEYQALEAAPPASVSLSAPAGGGPPAVSGVESVTQEMVKVPLPGDTRYRGRRLLVLYFDLTNMPFFDQIRMYSGANTYLAKHMAPSDMVAIMSFNNGTVRLKQEFTDDRTVLAKVVEDLVQAADDLHNGVATFEGGSAFGEDDDTFNMFKTDRQLAAIQTAVTGLGPLPEVKTFVYFGSGLRLNGADNMAQLRATVNAAVRANVTINPVDTRGLVATPPMGDATRASPGGIGMFSGSIAQSSTLRQQQSQDTYYALAKDTGGKAMFDNNDLSLGVKQAADAVTGYYIIGFYTSHAEKDGKYRRVKVALREGLSAELAYRPGYYGEKEYAKFNATERERQLEEALRAEDPLTEIPMAVEINYFQISSAEYYVPISVRMPGSELTRPRPTGTTKADIDVIREIKDEFGVTMRNARDRIEYDLDPAKAAEVSRRSIQYETGFSLLPGNYTIKILARDATTGRIGTFLKSFVVPNLDREKERIPISTVVMTSQLGTRAAALANVKEKVSSDINNPLILDGQKLIPSVTRTFSASRPLYVFLQAYERDTATMRPLVAFVTFYKDGVKVFETDPLALESWDPKLRAVPIRFTLSLGQLTPGSYDCQVTVLDPSSNRAAFWRAPIVVLR
jgi:VWFA-related protein